MPQEFDGRVVNYPIAWNEFIPGNFYRIHARVSNSPEEYVGFLMFERRDEEYYTANVFRNNQMEEISLYEFHFWYAVQISQDEFCHAPFSQVKIVEDGSIFGEEYIQEGTQLLLFQLPPRTPREWNEESVVLYKGSRCVI